MPVEPTTFDDLYDLGLSYREAHTLAATLPNLPNKERILNCHGHRAAAVTTDDDTSTKELADFTKRHTPILSGSDLYRVRILTKRPKRVVPLPHPFGGPFALHDRDYVEIVPLDPAHYDFDSDQAQLSDFGLSSPYFSFDDDAFDDDTDDPDDDVDRRRPRLPF